MSAPVRRDPIDAALLRRAEESDSRWEARRRVREGRQAAVEAENYLAADSRSRLAMRVNHLVQDVRRASRCRRPIMNTRLRDLVERDTPVTADELDNELIREAVVGARDFLSVEFLERGLAAARSVGRILVKTGGGPVALGTGFLVAPGLLITNEHVLTSSTLALSCVVEMDYEQNWFGAEKRSQVFVLEPKRFFLNDKVLDFALVAVATRSDRGMMIEDYGWLPLISAQGKIAITGKDYINIVQHPLGREKEVVLRDNRILDLRTGDDRAEEDIGPFLHYEADTEKGSSGSPVLNDQWEVIALHHSGVPAKDEQGRWLDKDNKVWDRGTQSLDDLQWIANEGVRVSSLVNAVQRAQVQAHEREYLNRFLSATPPSVLGASTEGQEQDEGKRAIAAATARTTSSPALPEAGESAGGALTRESLGNRSLLAESGLTVAAARSVVGAEGGQFSVDLPLRITVTLGPGGEGVAGTAVSLDVTGQATAGTGAPAAVDDFSDRRGFDRHFLGETVPLPAIKPDPRYGGLARIPRPSRPQDEFLLRYHHYSVLMCAGRRMAYLSACNVDFDARVGGGRGEGEAPWRLDPRLDANQQVGRAYYAGNDYDKGHLSRREDIAWGRDRAEAIMASSDSYYYPNAAPQHFLYNQSGRGKGLRLWGELENYISQQGEDQRTRLSIFNGPIFGESDKPLQDVLVPLAFFKIVIWRDGIGTPQATGFVLEQGELIASLRESFEPGEFQIRQRRIADVEALIDLDFGKTVRGWDRLTAATEKKAEAAPQSVAIATLDDVWL